MQLLPVFSFNPSLCESPLQREARCHSRICGTCILRRNVVHFQKIRNIAFVRKGDTMHTSIVKVKKLDSRAILPSRGSEFSAGADLYALLDEEINVLPGETVMIRTGLSMEIPVGYVGLIFARSGLASKKGLAPANKVGVVDSDYRGEFMIALHNHSADTHTVSHGDRVAQLVIVPYLPAEFEETDALSDTGRGAGGFGSTGK